MYTKCYSELITIESFINRLEYLRLGSDIGVLTFGDKRYLNQMLYNSPEWKRVRREIIMRDNGFDLAHADFPILSNIYIHHINPITVDDVLRRSGKIFDPENLISSSFETHNAIHFGSISSRESELLIIRTKNDTCPWK